MKVEVLVNLGTNDYPDHPFLAGSVHEVTDEVGSRIVANGHARVVVSEAEPEVQVQMSEQADPAITEPVSVAVAQEESKQDKPQKAALKSSKEK